MKPEPPNGHNHKLPEGVDFGDLKAELHRPVPPGQEELPEPEFPPMQYHTEGELPEGVTALVVLGVIGFVFIFVVAVVLMQLCK